MKVTWHDSGRTANRPPRYPEATDLDLSRGSEHSCTVPLRSPALRIGYYRIECERCGQHLIVGTMGRLDDPRSVKLACKITGGNHG